MAPKFNIGSLVVTRGVNEAMQKNSQFSELVGKSICRHAEGDWGDICLDDKQANEAALQSGERVMSAYPTGLEGESTIWIITEADRSVTTVLFPSEY